MSNSSPPPSSRGLANLERTRQQLQELDSLLQQMLALPHAEPSVESKPTAETAPAEVAIGKESASAGAEPNGDHGPKRLQTLTTVKAKPANGDASPDLKRPLPLPVLESPRKALEEASEKPTTAPAVGAAAPGNGPAPQKPRTSVPIDFDPALMDLSGPGSFDVGQDEEAGGGDALSTWGSTGRQAPAKRALIYRMLVRVDATFAWTLGLMGPVGEALATEKGKAWLGWLGVVCLLGAAAMAIGLYLGWTW